MLKCARLCKALQCGVAVSPPTPLGTSQVLPLDAALVNVVHDELVVECAEDCTAEVTALLEQCMTNAWLRLFPDHPALTRGLVEAHVGPNWDEAKG